MSILVVSGCILGCLYGGLTFVGGMMQFKQRKLPIWSGVITSFIGLAIIISVVRIFMNDDSPILLIISLLFMHIVAMINGLLMYGKITIHHHLIRLVLSLTIIILITAF